MSGGVQRLTDAGHWLPRVPKHPDPQHSTPVLTAVVSP